jgi:vacuolar protein sorting-associated protein 26
MAYFFASPIDVDIKLEGEELRKQVDMKTDKDKTISCPVYYDGDPVTGQACSSSALPISKNVINDCF